MRSPDWEIFAFLQQSGLEEKEKIYNTLVDLTFKKYFQIFILRFEIFTFFRDMMNEKLF